MALKFRRPAFIIKLCLFLTAACIVLLAILLSQNPLLENNWKDFEQAIFQDTAIRIKPDDVSLKPTDSDSMGLTVGTSFHLSSKTPLTKGKIEKNLQIDPLIDLEITQKDDTNFILKPKNSLENNQKYTLSLKVFEPGFNINNSKLRTLSWSFATSPKFKLLNTSPKNQQTEVALDTHIKINFNTDKLVVDQQKLTIKPKLNGSLVRDGKSLVFKPSQKLLPETIYQVSLSEKQDLEQSSQTLEQEVAFQFETLSDKTSTSQKGFTQRIHSFTDDIRPFFKIKGFEGSSFDNQKFTAKIQAFKSYQDFTDNLSTHYDFPDWSKYQLRKNFWQEMAKDLQLPVKEHPNLKLQKFGNQAFIELPKNYDYGSYLITLIPQMQGQEPLFSSFQITNLKAEVEVKPENMLVWVVDVKTNKKVDQAKIDFLKDVDVSYQTGEDGVIIFDKPKKIGYNHYNDFLLIEKSGQKLIWPLTNQNNYAKHIEDQFKTKAGIAKTANTSLQIFSDKQVYRSWDRVYLKGILGFVEDNQDQKFNLKLLKSTLSAERPGTGSIDLILKKDLKTKQEDTYQVYEDYLDLHGVPQGNYILSIHSSQGDKAIVQKNIKINSLGGYTIQLDNQAKDNQNGHFAGDRFKLKGRLFKNGLPASNFDLNYKALSKTFFGQEVKIVDQVNNFGRFATNQEGNFEIEIEPISFSEQLYQPGYQHFNQVIFFLQDENNQEVVIKDFNFRVFDQQDYFIWNAWREGGKGFLKIKKAKVNLSSFRQGQDFLEYTGKPVSVKIEQKISQINRTNKNPQFDPRTQKVVEKFNYSVADKGKGEVFLATNQNDEILYEFEVENDKIYTLKAEAKYANQKTFSFLAEVHGQKITSFDFSQNFSLSLHKDNNFTNYQDLEQNIFTTNKLVNISLVKNNQQAQIQNPERFLVLLADDKKFYQHKISSTPSLDMQKTKDISFISDPKFEGIFLGNHSFQTIKPATFKLKSQAKQTSLLKSIQFDLRDKLQKISVDQLQTNKDLFVDTFKPFDKLESKKQNKDEIKIQKEVYQRLIDGYEDKGLIENWDRANSFKQDRLEKALTKQMYAQILETYFSQGAVDPQKLSLEKDISNYLTLQSFNGFTTSEDATKVITICFYYHNKCLDQQSDFIKNKLENQLINQTDNQESRIFTLIALGLLGKPTSQEIVANITLENYQDMSFAKKLLLIRSLQILKHGQLSRQIYLHTKDSTDLNQISGKDKLRLKALGYLLQEDDFELERVEDLPENLKLKVLEQMIA